MNRTPGTPWLGAAYYPEDWPEALMAEDIRLMREAGMNVMRVGEFAWSRMEPREGDYDLAWLHRVVERLHEAGIATILCTPSATPPAWLISSHPDVLMLRADGRRTQHGARRHCCSNNPEYRAATARIVRQFAREFAGKPGVIGWQLDNEIYPWDRGCCCPVCVAKFQARLRERYGSVEALNRAWCLSLWSQEYQDFSQVPPPLEHTWHHPSLIEAYLRFQSDSHAEFLEMQADLLRAGGVRVPIGTDMMPFGGQHYVRTHHKLDLVQFNHYNDESNLWQAAFWMDYIRTLKPAPFWNTETSTCWNGATTAAGYREPGFCRANSWLPIALGGEMNCYWVWRAHWAGQELMHGSVVSSCGRPLHIIDEVREVAAGFERSRAFLTGTRCTPSGLALHFSGEAWNTFLAQPMTPRLAPSGARRDLPYVHALLDSAYRPLVEAQFRPDVIDPSADLAPYRLLHSPLLPCLEEGDLATRLVPWLEQGGIWIAGPLTDVRNADGAKYVHAPFGHLEELAGVRCPCQVPGHPRDFAVRWWGGAECSRTGGFRATAREHTDAPGAPEQSAGGYWYDGFECQEGTERLGEYTEGPLAGLAAAVWRPLGKGGIVLLGTWPAPAALLQLMRWAGSKVGVGPVAEADGNLLVVPRAGPAGEGLVCVELHNRPAVLRLARPMTDLLSGERLEGEVAIAPFGVRVLKVI